METEENGTSIYCILVFISFVVILFILLNLYSVFTVSPIDSGAVANDILLISIMIVVLVVILYMYRKSKKDL